MGVFVWQQFVTARLAAENQQLREEANQLAALIDENARLTNERIDPAELKRLRDGQEELLRLRGQAAQLRREAQEAKATAARALAQSVALATLTNSPTADPPVDAFTANVTASVGWKQSLVMGGWQSSSGKRAFVLLEPATTADADSVRVRSHIVEIPENLLRGLGLEELKADGSANNRSGILSAEQTSSLLKTLETTDGVAILAAPQAVTQSGRQAQVSVTESLALPSGQTYTTGPVIDVVSTIAPDQQSVSFTVNAQVNLPRTPAGP